MICDGPHLPTHKSNHFVETVEFGADHLRALLAFLPDFYFVNERYTSLLYGI